jgi:serine protease Do
VDVAKGGPADKAGLKKNDVVIAYRGKGIPDSSTLRNDVAETLVGTEAKVTVLRNGKREEYTAKIGTLEEATKLLAASVKERLGVEVRSPNSVEASKYGLNPDQGVTITREDSKEPLREAGFEIGDMILALNNQPIDSMEGFVDLVSLLKPKEKIAILALDHRTGILEPFRLW